MNKPILTIGIPTYNHGHSLRECLACITNQFADSDIRDTVEIFVSDNASTDDTREIVESYQKKFSNIRYARNDKNLEFDRNVDAVLSNAKGVFCWTLSSNEYIEPGSIAYVLSAISQHGDVAYLCVSNQKKDKGKVEMRRFADGNQWLKKMGLFGGQISQCIFNMSDMVGGRAKYYDNAWFHLALSWEIIAHRPVVLLPCLFKLPEEELPCRWARDGGGGQRLRTHIFLKQIVADLPRYGYDRGVVDAIVLDLAKDLPRAVASAKLYGLPVAWDRFSLLVSGFYGYPLYLFPAMIVFFAPTFLLRLIKNST